MLKDAGKDKPDNQHAMSLFDPYYKNQFELNLSDAVNFHVCFYIYVFILIVSV